MTKVSTPIMQVILNNLYTNLFQSELLGISAEINTIEVCADITDADLETHRGFLASVTLTNSVAFVAAYDTFQCVAYLSHFLKI